jgi:hypothetical protein
MDVAGELGSEQLKTHTVGIPSYHPSRTMAEGHEQLTAKQFLISRVMWQRRLDQRLSIVMAPAGGAVTSRAKGTGAKRICDQYGNNVANAPRSRREPDSGIPELTAFSQMLFYPTRNNPDTQARASPSAMCKTPCVAAPSWAYASRTPRMPPRTPDSRLIKTGRRDIRR